MGSNDRVCLSVARGCLSDSAGLLNAQVAHLRHCHVPPRRGASGTCVLTMTGMTLK